MLTLKINDVSVFFHTRAEFDHIGYDPFKDSTYMKLESTVPDEQAQIFFNVGSSFNMTRSWLLLAGHDAESGSIDYNVPQDWFNQEYTRTGKEPRAYWSYEKNKLFGEPLYHDTVIYEARANIKKAFTEWIASKITEGETI